MSLTEEQIAAYADGELAGEERALAEAAIAADPALAARVEAHRALRAQLAAHYAPVLEQPVPDHLAAMLQPQARPAEVVSFAAERQKRGLAPALRTWGVYIGPALAAAVVAAVVLLPLGSKYDPIPTNGMAGPQLAAALDNQLVAEQSAEDQTRILLSFENRDSRYCRVYRSGGAGGIACRGEQGWQIEQEMLIGKGQSTEFRQAGSEAALLAQAQDMARGEALDAAGEAAAKGKGWR